MSKWVKMWHKWYNNGLLTSNCSINDEGGAKMTDQNNQVIIATWIGIIVNVLLTIFKTIGGFLSGSRALLADALHSASDIVSSVVILFAVKIAKKPPDDEHPYGHGKAENIATIIVALLLIVVGVEISISAIKALMSKQIKAPGSIALFILIISIILKEGLYHYKMFIGKKYRSTALISDAWHHRSDSLSSLAALIGVSLAMIGEHYHLPLFIYGDSVASIIVSIIVIRVGYYLAKESSLIMMEKVLSKDEIKPYEATVHAIDGVMTIDQMHARTHGRYVIIDIKISVDPYITVKEGHDIAHKVRNKLIQQHEMIEDVLVHVNPFIANDN